MTASRRRWWSVGLVVALLVAGCGDDAESSEPERPPLSSPPDPGPIPDDDGLAAGVRGDVIASTVGISGVACGRTATGSGFTVADGLVATNAHVILGMDEIRVHTVDGRDVVGEPVAFDAVDDLALLRVPGLDLAPLPLGSADDQSVGVLVGWRDGPEPDPSPYRIDRPVTVRIEAVASRERVERRSWLVAAEIELGDSGGALVDRDGTAVGIAYATSREGSGVGYAVRASRLEDLLARGFDENLVVPPC